ncbi:MAG: hypothetical protein VX738_01105 [Planctomycetota bacterium]|nr:hypothetical protein [Planctomycetota bacterium]
MHCTRPNLTKRAFGLYKFAAIHLWATVLLGTLLSGCTPWRIPKIDPQGAAVFSPNESTILTHPFRDSKDVGGFPNPFPKPVFRGPEPIPSTVATHPSTTATPNGQTVITPGSIWVSPRVIAAPIGSAVLVKSGLVGKGNELLRGKKLEWTIAAGSIGKIESAGGGNPNTFRWLFPSYGNKITESYAHTLSADRTEVVRPEPAELNTEIHVRRGECWVTVSAQEAGTTELLIGAATELEWDKQFQQIKVHWVDAQWQFPSSVSAPAGQDQILTTSVLRQSDQSPLAGWTIRYRLVSNRSATLSSTQNNEQLDVIETQTNSSGKASIRVSPNQAQSGVVHVFIEIIRPAEEDQQIPALVVGESSAQVSWNAPQLAIETSGPKTVELGQPLRYTVAVSNPGNQTASDVVVIQTLPFELNVDASNPVANLTGRQATWNLGDLPPQTEKQITIQYQTDTLGHYNQLLTARCKEGLESQSESLLDVVESPLEIKIQGPVEARLQETVHFQIFIHNHSNQLVPSVQLMETLGPGLVHVSRSNPEGNPTVRKIAFQSSQIEPGKTMVKTISMRVTQTGTLCHQLLATLPQGLRIQHEACLEVQGASVAPEGELLAIDMKGPLEFPLQSTNTHRFRLTNQSDQSLTNVSIQVTLPPALQSQLASEGHRSEGRSIILDVGTLEAGKIRTLVIQSLATQSAPNQELQLAVTADTLQKIEKQILLTITPAEDRHPPDLSPPADRIPNLDPSAQPQPAESEANVPDPPDVEPPLPDLKIQLSVLKEPVELGENNVFFLYIRNPGKSDATQISTVLTASPGLKIIAISHPLIKATEFDAAVADDQHTATLPTITKLTAGKEMQPYKIQVKTVGTGEHKLDVSLISAELKNPLTASDTNRIVPKK